MKRKDFKKRTAFILAVIMTVMNCLSLSAEELPVSENGIVEEVNETEAEESAVVEEPEVTEDIVVEDVEETVEEEVKKSAPEEVKAVEDNEAVVEEEPEEPELLAAAPEEEAAEVSEVQEDTEEVVIESVESDPDEILRADDSDYGVWHETDGILWMLSSNHVLTISANADAEDPGYIGDFGVNLQTGESNVAWLKDHRNDIYEVEFKPSAIDDSVKVYRIGVNNFALCQNLGKVTIPSSVIDIKYGAFTGCSNLSSVTIKENDRFVTDDKSNILYRKITPDSYEMLFAPLNQWGKELKISDKTTVIASEACWGAKCYEGTLYVPPSVEEIGSKAFMGCENLTRIYLGTRAFGEDDDPQIVEKCKSDLEIIESKDFSECNKLKWVYIPSSVRRVDQTTFDKDTYLTYVYCYAVNPNLTTKSLVQYQFDVTDGFNQINFPNTECEIIFVPWNHCIIEFNATISVTRDNKGRRLSPICVKYGTTVAATCTDDDIRENGLYVLEKEGYVFQGWLLKDGVYFRPSLDRIISDTTIKAKWKAIFTIKFITGVGSFPEADYSTGSRTSAVRTISTGNALLDSEWPADPEKKNARFIGWQIGNKDYGSILLKNKDDPGAVKFTNRIKRETYKFQGMNYTLTAFYEDYPLMNFWNENSTEDLYKKHKGGDTVGMPIAFNAPFTQEQVDDLNTISMNYWLNDHQGSSRWEFQGWYSKVGGKGTKLRVDTTMPLKYYIYFKQYLETTYHYGYDVNDDGTPDYTDKDLHIEAKRDYSLRLPPYRKGYQFEGWWSTPDGDNSGKKYAALIPGNSMKEDKVFYAHWEKLCTITLDRCFKDIPGYDQEYMDKHPELSEMQTAENVTRGSALYYNYLIPYDKKAYTNEADRYKFAGWYTERNGQGTKIESDTKIEDDITVYAYWVKGWSVNYFVDIKKTGGKVLFWGTVVDPEGANLPVPPKDLGDPKPEDYGYLGYLFDGWADEETGDPPDTTLIVTGDMSFNAIWYDDPNTPNDPQVTVSFDSAGGPEVESQTVSVNTPLKDPEVEWKDHKFLGWFTDTTYTRQWDFVTDMVSENMILHAKWKYWTEEDEAQYQDNLNGIYWVKIVRTEKASLAQYFTEGGLKYSYDTHIIKFNRFKRMVKGRNHGSTLITARRVDGTPYEKAVRVFVIDQRLQDMYVYNTDTTLEASDFLTVSGFLPDRWQSTKPKVASIDPKTGFIHVNGRGKTTIKAFYKEKAVKAVLYSKVPKFAKPFVRMKTGQSKKLKIRKMRRRDIVSWNVVSDNKGGSAEIDENGRITALTAGDVTVVAYAYGEKISCKVHIEPPILRQKSIALYTNKKKKLKLSNTKLKYVEWTSTNDQVAYVDPVTGTVYGLKNGRATLKTTAGGVTNVCSVLVTDKVNLNGNKK